MMVYCGYCEVDVAVDIVSGVPACLNCVELSEKNWEYIKNEK